MNSFTLSATFYIRKEYNKQIITAKGAKLMEINGQRVSLRLTEKTAAIPAKNWLPAYKFDIVLRGTTTPIGNIDARIGYNDNVYYGGHIGYAIDSQYRGKGYAVEAVLLLRQIFFENNMSFIYISNNPDNFASIRVCEKVGANFVELAELPNDNSMRITDGDTHKNIWKLDF